MPRAKSVHIGRWCPPIAPPSEIGLQVDENNTRDSACRYHRSRSNMKRRSSDSIQQRPFYYNLCQKISTCLNKECRIEANFRQIPSLGSESVALTMKNSFRKQLVELGV
jgi:hypothetical protein